LKYEIYKLHLTVPASAIDVRGHVNNITYLQWCLDAAEEHWESKTTKILREKYIWYVLNHSISYLASVFENEEIEVQTWVDNYGGVRCERHYKIVRLKDEKSVVEAKTVWCLLNGRTLRPTKITEEISNLFL